MYIPSTYLVRTSNGPEDTGCNFRRKASTIVSPTPHNVACPCIPKLTMFYHSLLSVNEVTEGNVFSHVRLSVCSQFRSHPTTTHMSVPSMPPLAQVPSLLVISGAQDWRPVQTCSLEDLAQCWYQVAGYWSMDDGRQAVFILLECFLVEHMSHFSYSCKMQCPLNLVLENWEYLWFYWTFWIVILDCGLKLHKLSIHTLVMLQKWLEIH